MDLTLVVMAAGAGSRFGGLKQITPIDEDGNFIIDYSVFDALRVGFKKVVFVIREEFLHDFESTIGKRLEGKIEIDYAFQKLSDIPVSMDLKGRTKPWGTVQAILAANPYVKGSFVVVNADDFYGKNAFVAAAEFLKNVNTPYTYANISYEYGVTKSKEGSVKRGVLSLEGNQVNSIIECSVGCENGKIIAHPLVSGNAFEIEESHPVSMNFFAFQYDIFALLEEFWQNYFKQSEEDILEGEALLPECLKENIESGRITILNQPSNSTWLGMTYRSDLEFVMNSIKQLKNEGDYGIHLWEDINGKERSKE